MQETSDISTCECVYLSTNQRRYDQHSVDKIYQHVLVNVLDVLREVVEDAVEVVLLHAVLMQYTLHEHHTYVWMLMKLTRCMTWAHIAMIATSSVGTWRQMLYCRGPCSWLQLPLGQPPWQWPAFSKQPAWHWQAFSSKLCHQIWMMASSERVQIQGQLPHHPSRNRIRPKLHFGRP